MNDDICNACAGCKLKNAFFIIASTENSNYKVSYKHIYMRKRLLMNMHAGNILLLHETLELQ